MIYDDRTDKNYKYTHIQTKRYEEFKYFRNRWYPNGKKEVPLDIELVPIIIKNWYLGGGSIRRGSKNNYRIQLSTDSFNASSISLLMDLLSGLDLTPKSTDNRIYLYRMNDVKKFLRFIDKFPPSMTYKGGFLFG